MGMWGDAARPWSARYAEAATIRRLGVIEHVACRERASGARRLLVGAHPSASRADAAPLVAEIARVHGLIDHPRVPRVAEIDDGEAPFVALACDAVTDLEALASMASGASYPIAYDYDGAAWFTVSFLEMLDQVHRITDAVTGFPITMGAVTTANVLVSEDAGIWYVGWGHPWRLPARAAYLADAPAAVLAPEAGLGLAPSPGTDLAAAGMFLLQLYHRMGVPPAALAQALAGSSAVPDSLRDRILVLMNHVQGAVPQQRSIRRFVEDFLPTMDLLGIHPSEAAFGRDVAAHVALWRGAQPAGEALLVARDGAWCVPPGGTLVSLERRPTLRRLFDALVVARREASGQPLTIAELLRAGWPGENPRAASVRNRIYVAIAELRAAGLRGVLLRHDTGYLLDPEVPLAWSDGPPPSDER